MSKFIRTAGEIIAVAVAVAAAIPSGGTSLLAAGLAVSAGTASAIAAGVSISITALEALTAKKPTQVGNPMDWKSDPNAGIPHIAGRMYTAGQIIYRNTWGKDNVYETIQTVYSTGPIKGFENLYVDGVVTSVSGTIVNINDRGKMAASTQLGAQPEARQLGDLGPPNFTAQSKMSGLAASSISFTYDTKGGHTFTTEPQTGYVVLGTPVYDPRQDSTYPGGNGSQRSNDETTWSFTGYDNPGLKALSYLIGYRQKGSVVIGVGLPISAIRVDQLVEMANVCDANGWKMGGVIMSTDERWTMYSQILQAGGAVPTRSGTRTGCIVNTPKVSLATFERDDIIGDWSIQGSTSRRARINAIVPSYMAEQSVVGETSDANSNTVLQTTVTWGMAAAGIIIVDDYVTFDGGQRQKAVSYPFVTGHTTTTDILAPAQVAQLARYDIENSREFGPIAMTMKPRWMGYQAGDVITGGASTSEMGLVGQDIMLLQRSFSPANMTVSMTARSETKAKHAFALGQTTTPPPTPALSGPPLIPVPGAVAWALTAGELASDNGSTSAALFLNGTSDSNSIDAVVVEMRVSTGEQAAADDWEGVTTLAASFSGQLTITSVKDQTAYQVAVSYRKGAGTGTRLILGPASAGQTAVPWSDGVVGDGKPEDNATVGAPAGTSVNGVPVEQITVSIDSLTTKVQDLVATYGDTESAAAAASAAQAAETAAQDAQTNAATARDQAQAAFAAADAARVTAAASASSASTYADGAASDMNVAGTSASAAHQSEVNAGLAAAQAAGSASGASSSASSAAASQNAAGQSASAANTSATDAATSAGQASTFAGNASTSASNASTSATNALGSANQASTYASQASGSATNASNSATSAATQASNAQSSATAAGASATSASTSANNAQGYAGNASTSASSAQSSAASASGSAAAAQQSASVAASVGPGFLNANGAFGSYSVSPGLPSGWSDWQFGGLGTRATGQSGSYAYRVVAPANQYQGLVQAIYLTAGDYVIQVDAWCEAGDWGGAGVHLASADGKTAVADLNCSTDPDLGLTVGKSGPGVRRWRKFVTIAYTGNANIYLATNWDIYGTTDAKTLDWYSCGIRPASAAESAGQQGLANAATALAQISSNQSAQASVNTAQATFNTNINTTVGTNTSSIASLQTTVSTNAASAAQQVSTLTAFANAAPNLVTDVGSWSFSGVSYAPTSTWGPYIGGVPTATGLFEYARSPQVAVDVGATYTASADPLQIGGSSGAWDGIDILAYNSAGQIVGQAPVCALAGVNFDDSRARSVFTTSLVAPAGTSYMVMRGLAYTGSGTGSAGTVGMRKPKLERGSKPTAYTTEGQTASLASSVSVLTATTANVAARINTAVFQVTAQAGTSRGLLNITADGYGASSIDLVAGSINLWSQTGANTALKALAVDSNGNVSLGSDLYLSNGRIVQNNGSVMKVQGTGFGSSNQFIEWFGPTMAISSCTEANATFYLKVDGSAYFGGTLSAGVIKNSSQSTDTSATALCVIGPFSTNGKAKNVVCSYTYKHFYTCTSRTGTSSGSGSSQITIERSTDSGSTWATVTTLNAAGSTSIVVDGQPGVPDQVTYTASGSTTFTDNTGATATMMLRMRVSARSEPTLGGSSITGTLISQNMSIVSTE